MKRIVVIVGVLMMTLLLFTTCRPQAPSPAPGPTPTPPPTTTTEPIEWKYLSYVPPPTNTGTNPDNSEWILSEIEKRSGGKITFERFWSSALGPPAEYPKMLSGNVIQMALVGTGYVPAIFKLTRGFELQYLTEDSEALTATVMRLYDTYPPFQEEFTKNGMMLYWPNSGAKMTINSSFPAYKWEDFSGKKVRVYGMYGDLWKKWGANPVSIPFTEVYQALQTGVVDVTTGTMFVSQKVMKFYEVAPYVIDAGFGSEFLGPETISLKAWNELPDDLKEIFVQVAKDAHVMRWTQNEPLAEQDNTALFQEGDATLIQWSDKERERAAEQGMPEIRSTWLDEMNKEGLPGDVFLKKISEGIEEYREANPTPLWTPVTYGLCKGGGVYEKGKWSPLP